MKHLGLGFLAASVLVSGPALADPGEAGQLALGAERLMGFSHSRHSSESEFGEQSSTYNNLTLLANPMAGFVTAYSVPRVALDYFPTQGVSIGGAISYTRVGISSKLEPNMGESTESSGTLSMFIFSPRVGYAAMFSESVGIWPRAGITYLKSSTSDDDDESKSEGSAVALSIEAPLLFMPVDNVAITLGPTIDYGLSASGEDTDSEGNTTEDDDNPAHEFGVQGGIVVFL
ncbi:MAG TPA: hypothetical protein VI197_23595 [Polyangiaceae bacterium]